jgi:hypothetical protein
MDEGLKKSLPWIGGAGVLLVVVAIFFLTRGGSDDAASSTTVVALATTTMADTATTLADTTTTAPVTTTVAPTTTSSTTTVPDTTTPPTADTVIFTNEGIFAGETWVHFGYDDEDTISAVTAVLESPTIDLGWDDGSICPSPSRTVKWNDLSLLFTKADTDFSSGGVPHFFAYQYRGDTPELFTTEGIGLGSTLNELDDAYGGPDLVIQESPLVPGEGYWTYKDRPWTGMWGFATGQTPSDTITSINGGQSCGE